MEKLEQQQQQQQMQKRHALSPARTRPSAAALPAVRAPVCEGATLDVLAACRTVDPKATISYVSKSEDGALTIRARAGSDEASVNRMEAAVRRALPLAALSLECDALDGAVVVSVRIPSRQQQLRLARERAGASPLIRLARAAAAAALLAGAAAHVVALTRLDVI